MSEKNRIAKSLKSSVDKKLAREKKGKPGVRIFGDKSRGKERNVKYSVRTNVDKKPEKTESDKKCSGLHYLGSKVRV